MVSKGFRQRRASLEKAPFDHSLGLMFAVANYFEADGLRITIESASPPRSALGGSSAAAAALIAALAKAAEASGDRPMSRKRIALLAHALEGSVAGVPCGLQDHLAAVYGGVQAWYWPQAADAPAFRRERIGKAGFLKELPRHLLIAYCGIPHESRSLNNHWVKQFLAGKHRDKWREICLLTQKFVDALKELNYKKAADCMNKELALRSAMTPWVLDSMGKKLTAAARANGCGARFTGAGGGGCIWALGEIENIDTIRGIWENLLKGRKDAALLDSAVDGGGLTVQIANQSYQSKGNR